jgi:hypothetical protein
LIARSASATPASAAASGNVRHPAGEVILLLGDELGEAVVDDAAERVDIRAGLGKFLDRRLRVGEDLLVVLMAVDDLLAHVEVVERRKRTHALAHIRVVGGHFAEHVEEFLREKVRVRIDTHGRCSPDYVFPLNSAPQRRNLLAPACRRCDRRAVGPASPVTS